MLIRCTAKLLKEIGLTNSNLADSVADEKVIGPNLQYINCLTNKLK